MLGFRLFPHNININNIFWAVCSVIRTLLTQSFFFTVNAVCVRGGGGGSLAFDPGRSLVEQFPSERPPRNSFDRSVSSDTSDSEVSPSAGLPEAAGSPLRSLVTLIGGSVSRKWRPEAPLIWSGLRRFSLSECSVRVDGRILLNAGGESPPRDRNSDGDEESYRVREEEPISHSQDKPGSPI